MGVFMKVSEIFKSIEGEGIRMGQSAVFVRLHGCNLRCSYCDSMYAVEGPDFKLMSVGEVLAAVEAYRNESGVKCVTLTGGEPLIHEGVSELLTKFSEAGFEVNIETNGTVPCKWQLPGLFYTMDWKCKSSGMSEISFHSAKMTCSSSLSGVSKTCKKRKALSRDSR